MEIIRLQAVSFRSGIVEQNEVASERELLRDARENRLPR